MRSAPGGATLRVRLIGKDNGVGLSRDFAFLSAALSASGCEVSVRGCERRERKRRRSWWMRLGARWRLRQRRQWPRPAAGYDYDLNLMLEHVWPQFLHQAGANVIVPNPEWFDRRDLSFLDGIDAVWAKTQLAQSLFQQRGRRTSLIGFDSEDRYRPQVARQPRCFHLAGRSPLKGTARLLTVWRRHPEWPQLTVVQDDAAEPVSAPNIVYTHGYLSEEALLQLQNEHQFHLCTSEAEGWGHYLVEAMSLAAVVVTVDAAPMNELIDAQRGVLVAARRAEAHNLAYLYRFEETALESAMSRLLALPPAEHRRLGQAARAWFLANKAGFDARVARALSELPGAPSASTFGSERLA